MNLRRMIAGLLLATMMLGSGMLQAADSPTASHMPRRTSSNLSAAHDMSAMVSPTDPRVLMAPPAPSVRDYSWIYIDAPPPPELIKVHDILTVEVDEKAEVIVNSRFNRQRNASFTAELKEFIRLRSDGPTIENSGATQPSINGTLQNRLQTIGQLTDTEGITYKIAATVVEVLPNGTIILEARKSIRTNQDVFEYRLTGRIDKGKIRPDRSARSEDIAELKIDRLQHGKVFDSTKTNWGTRVLDVIFPF